MSHVRHQLDEEFPEEVETIRRLTIEDARFAALAERYHLVNGEIHRIESGEEAASDERWEDLRKVRLRLKDDIFARLTSVAKH